MDTSGIKAGDLVKINGPAAKAAEPAAHIEAYYAKVLDNPGGGSLTVVPISRMLAAGKTFAPFKVRSRLVFGHWYRDSATERAGVA